MIREILADQVPARPITAYPDVLLNEPGDFAESLCQLKSPGNILPVWTPCVLFPNSVNHSVNYVRLGVVYNGERLPPAFLA